MKYWHFFYLFLFIHLLTPWKSFAQEDDEFTKELSYGLMLTTNGGIIGGGMFKYAKIVTPTTYYTLGVEIVGIKHPKELSYPSPITENTFVFGKQNNLFSIRPQYGREILLFKKAPQEGMQINGILAGGPSIGIVKPYLILYDYGQGVVTEQYDPKKHQTSLILGSGGFFSGFDKSKVVLGGNIKAALSFEFGAFQNLMTGIEVGFNLEGYSQKIMLMAQAENKQIFTSGYLTIYFGFRK